MAGGQRQPHARRESPSDSVKVTVYLTRKHLLKLEEVRLARLREGRRVDKSSLVREAIDLLR